jgi:hypothetical protein
MQNLSFRFPCLLLSSFPQISRQPNGAKCGGYQIQAKQHKYPNYPQQIENSHHNNDNTMTKTATETLQTKKIKNKTEIKC